MLSVGRERQNFFVLNLSAGGYTCHASQRSRETSAFHYCEGGLYAIDLL